MIHKQKPSLWTVLRHREHRFAVIGSALAIALLCGLGARGYVALVEARIETQIRENLRMRERLEARTLRRLQVLRRLSLVAKLERETLHEVAEVAQQIPNSKIQEPNTTQIEGFPSPQPALSNVEGSQVQNPESRKLALSLSKGPNPEVRTLFPAFDHAIFPVSRTPDWGTMRTPAEWDRVFGEIPRAEYVAIPPYNLRELQHPLSDLSLLPITEEKVRLLTAKLFYSTRFFGAYDLDSAEFTAVHPGLDLKLPRGTPIGSIAGGRVHAVREESGLGLHVIIEHRRAEETFFSIYGHLEEVWVAPGEDVTPGKLIGTVGMTGTTTAPHLHLQIDRGRGEEEHFPYWPRKVPSPEEAAQYTEHPISFIEAN